MDPKSPEALTIFIGFYIPGDNLVFQGLESPDVSKSVCSNQFVSITRFNNGLGANFNEGLRLLENSNKGKTVRMSRNLVETVIFY